MIAALWTWTSFAHDRAPRWRPPTVYHARVKSGPAHVQVAATCRYESLLSHVQNLTSIAFSADFLTLKRMKENARHAFATGQWPSDGLIAPVAALEERDSFWSTVATVRAVDGLLPQTAFRYTDAFLREMTGGGHIPSVLNDRLAMSWREADAALRARDLFARALAGVDPACDSAAITESILCDNAIIEHHPQSESAVDAAERFVRARIDAGLNVVLYAVWRMDHFDAETKAFVPLADVATAHVRRNRRHLSGHAVVIDGYDVDGDGRLTWLWLKNSRGAARPDHGTIHMHAEYFRAHVVSVNALKNSVRLELNGE